MTRPRGKKYSTNVPTNREYMKTTTGQRENGQKQNEQTLDEEKTLMFALPVCLVEENSTQLCPQARNSSYVELST